MLKFIKRLIIFLFVIFVIDIILISLIRKSRPSDYDIFIKSKSEFFNEKLSTDLLIIGDSHVSDALDTRILESKSNYSSFNLGIYHASPIENYFTLKAALAHLDNPPSILVLGTNPQMFQRKLSKGTYTQMILPLGLSSLSLEMATEDGFDAGYFLKSIQESYLFGSFFRVMLNIEQLNQREIEGAYRGHLKFYNHIPNVDWANFSFFEDSKSYNIQLDYFKKTIELAQSLGIEVIIVHPPVTKEELAARYNLEQFAKFKKSINQTTLKYNLPVYFDYPNNPNIMFNSSYQHVDFLNTEHLNYYGAQKYTKGFCEFLIKYNL
jgi:hypothetical protein